MRHHHAEHEHDDDPAPIPRKTRHQYAPQTGNAMRKRREKVTQRKRAQTRKQSRATNR